MKTKFDLGKIARANFAADSIEPDELVQVHFFLVFGIVFEIVDELFELRSNHNLIGADRYFITISIVA